MYSGVTQRWKACTATQERSWSNRVRGAELAAQREHGTAHPATGLPKECALGWSLLWWETALICAHCTPCWVHLQHRTYGDHWEICRTLFQLSGEKKGDEIVENFPASPVFENSLLCPATESEFNKYKAVINYLSQSPVFLQHKAICYFGTSLSPKPRNNSASH